jgi:NAD(P)-dependent dehydrogenase (short-subunit alcohol dehydrogenase family)
MDLGLRGKKALITGSTKGIGRAVTDLFADEGCDVSICSRNEADVATAIQAIATKGVKATGRAIDVADGAALKSWVTDGARELGGIDILVANVSALAIDGSEESWRKGFEIDIMHTVRSVDAAMPYLEQSDSASIVIISSVSGVEIDFAAGPYGVFKAALINYAKGLSNQLAAKGIRVNTVSPGNTYFKGGVWHQIEQNMPELYEQSLRLNKTGRMATPQEVATAVVFLASPIATFITGTNLMVDGALTNRVQY